MVTDQFRSTDVAEFLSLATEEGWICDEREFDFLLGSYPTGCLVKRLQGLPVAFITAARYDRSGWLGNLLVHRDFRRRGFGAELMAEVIAVLEQSGVETLWLTASPSGKPLYEQLGFREIDQVQRWYFENCTVISTGEHHTSLDALLALDAKGWGDRRKDLMNFLVSEGSLVTGNDAFLMTRTVGAVRQIGPLAGLADDVVALLKRVVTMPSSGDRLCLDVPAGNRIVSEHLREAGFQVVGSTVLMYQGVLPAYQPELIGALASMGSMG